MSSYGGITIIIPTEGEGWLPEWQRQTYTSRSKPIGASRENVQFGGLGNYVIAIRVRLLSTSDFATLRGWENDGTARALVDLLGDGVDHASVYLMEIRNIKTLAWSTVIEAELVFERVGA